MVPVAASGEDVESTVAQKERALYAGGKILDSKRPISRYSLAFGMTAQTPKTNINTSIPL
jgi:hypothetical protein